MCIRDSPFPLFSRPLIFTLFAGRGLGSLYHNSAAIQKKDGQRPVFLTLFTPHTFYATHNPVYSRRTNPSFRAQPQRASSRSVIQSAGEAGAKNLLPSYPARLNPVSYTHLDVYKRQGPLAGPHPPAFQVNCRPSRSGNPQSPPLS